jgi:hypothetical protein
VLFCRAGGTQGVGIPGHDLELGPGGPVVDHGPVGTHPHRAATSGPVEPVGIGTQPRLGLGRPGRLERGTLPCHPAVERAPSGDAHVQH